MAGFHFLQFRTLCEAAFTGGAAAVLEPAPSRRIDGAGQFAFQTDTLFFFLDLGVRNGDGRQERLGIGVQRIAVSSQNDRFWA